LELVKILRELSRRRRLVAPVLGVSLLVGLLLAFKPGLPPQSRQYQVSLASADILIDTSDSQVVAIGGKGPDLPTLAGRANLIGNLMTAGPLKEAIAKQAGVPASEISVVPPANVNTPGVVPAPVTPPAARGVPDVDATVLSLSTDETLPILHVVAQAPSTDTARKLSSATIVAVRRYLGSVAASQHIPAANQLVIRQFGAPVAQTATRGLPRRYALIATIVLALLGCGAIIGGSWFARSWRQIEEAEARGHAAREGEGAGADLAEPVRIEPEPRAGSGQAVPAPAGASSQPPAEAQAKASLWLRR
jgi:hypothetical protein